MTVIYSCAAYDVRHAPTCFNGQFIKALNPGMQIACKLQGKDNYKCFTVGSIWHAYATDAQVSLGMSLESFIERNRKAGGTDVWISGNSVMITSHKQDSQVYWEVKLDDLVSLHGRVYRVKPDHNDNLKLVPECLPLVTVYTSSHTNSRGEMIGVISAFRTNAGAEAYAHEECQWENTVKVVLGDTDGGISYTMSGSFA